MSVKQLFILVLAVTMGLFSGCGEHHRDRVVVYESSPPASGVTQVTTYEAPPADRVEVMTAIPSSDHVWIPGHWIRSGDRWTWISGHWERRHHPGAEWVH